MLTKSRRFTAHSLAVFASLFLVVGILFLSLDFVMSDESWFTNEYQKLGTSQEIGISDDDITRAIMQLVKYMQGSEDSIDLEVTENGSVVSMYNDRERLHMLDVRVLFQTWRTVCIIGALLAFLIFAAIALTAQKEALRIISRSFLIGSGVFTLIIAALGVFLVLDFNAFWTGFHHLFFTNDLWLLSYATDRMIRICPAELFYDIIVRFGLIFVIAFAVLIVSAAIVSHTQTKKLKAGEKSK